eukprot:TRINITY_DN4002_c0_g1_i1.p1 TRINITY_DN4002_c0_g1~~TRINITY_DN4002_c0_g1_i1.p1  ORF type:complete len:113 (+),score=7.35 TRINITY_DN4002_c0_g1_i1:249-587(+)
MDPLQLGRESRSSSDTNLVDMRSQSASQLQQSFAEDSPFSDSPSAGSAESAAKQKVVLSPREIEKLRKSFEAAKQRRASGQEEHSDSAITAPVRSSRNWHLCMSVKGFDHTY